MYAAPQHLALRPARQERSTETCPVHPIAKPLSEHRAARLPGKARTHQPKPPLKISIPIKQCHEGRTCVLFDRSYTNDYPLQGQCPS